MYGTVRSLSGGAVRAVRDGMVMVLCIMYYGTVAGGAVPVPYRYATVRYMLGMDGVKRYSTAPVRYGTVRGGESCCEPSGIFVCLLG